MAEKAIQKLENPARVKELDPFNTLKTMGFKEDMILCDIGAGTGLFSFAAAQISKNDIYALEISDTMIHLLKNRKDEINAYNLNILKVESSNLPLENNICDMVILVTVLHEIEDKFHILDEINRILKKDGQLLIIEFHQDETPFGPPLHRRISIQQVVEICNSKNLRNIDKRILGENFYSTLFQK